MATQTIKMVIQFRRDTTANWLLNKDVTPAAGEPCFDLDTKTLKIGDGKTTYEHLPVIGGSGISIEADGKSIVLEDGIVKLAGFDAAAVGAQPRKNAKGEIEWVIPSTDAEIETLQGKVSVLENDVDFLYGILVPDEEGAETLEGRVTALETDVDKIEGSIQSTVANEVTAQINDFASKISEDEKVNTFKELVDYVANHGGEVATMAADITNLQSLVGNESVQDQIEHALDTSGFIKEDELTPIKSIVDEFPNLYTTKEEVHATAKQVAYEVTSKPEGTLVDYRDKEIRVMCPADTNWKLQNSGENADKNAYYIGFKAYAPKGAESFKEDLAEIISDETMYYFEDNDFAGVDEYGRKYSIVWLPVAKYDSTADTWTYYGDMSTTDHYIGWYYSVEWYDANGKKIGADTIRINLANKDCYTAIEPYYMANAVKGVKVNGTLMDIVNGVVDITVPETTVGVKGSDEIKIAEDGTLSIGTINMDKIVQPDGYTFVLDGGCSV